MYLQNEFIKVGQRLQKLHIFIAITFCAVLGHLPNGTFPTRTLTLCRSEMSKSTVHLRISELASGAELHLFKEA